MTAEFQRCLPLDERRDRVRDEIAELRLARAALKAMAKDTTVTVGIACGPGPGNTFACVLPPRALASLCEARISWLLSTTDNEVPGFAPCDTEQS